MRPRLLPIAVSVALMAVGFAPAPFPKRERQRQDPTDVCGTWEFVIWEHNGERERQFEQTILAEVTRERFALRTREGGWRESFVMRLDATASPPSFTWS